MQKRVNIAFSFDANYYMPALVAISSLLEQGSKSDVFYDIYCLIKNIPLKLQKNIVRDVKRKSHNSNVHLIDVSKYFENAYECRNITTAAYPRLILHNLVSIDKIIYSDVDVIFNDNLFDIYNINLDSYYYGAVKDISINTIDYWNYLECKLPYWKTYMYKAKGNYHQSGFLILNLSKWREANINDRIQNLSNYDFWYQDMDILNLLWIDKQEFIYSVHPRYCYMPKHDYKKAIQENIITEEEYIKASQYPAIIHYPGEKPWVNPNVCSAEIWWNYVKDNTNYYRYFSKNLKPENCFWKKLFSVGNEYSNNLKRKVITILGVKIKF